MKRAIKYGVLALLAIVIAGVVAPFIRVDQYREQIRDGLQRSLHRRVDILGDTRLNLFRGPGFSVEKVVIHDDPSVGLEPLANVAELQASVRLSSLWAGNLEFSKVRFVEPSVNIVKPDSGAWNLAPLLAGAAAEVNVRLPEIEVTGGRLNFKTGNVKSAFYLTGVDLVMSPARGGLDIRFSLAPARTDRAAQGYGLFTGRGRWAAGKLDLDVELEKSSIEELVTLARGQSLGLHGRIASRAKITGPVTSLRISGQFDMEDIHRWDLIEGHTGGISMQYKGVLDFASERLELLAKDPVALKLVIGGIVHNPVWTVELALNGTPAASLVEIARHMGAPLPQGIAVEGKANGVIAYGSTSGVQGQINVNDALVQLDGGPELRMPHASLLLFGDEVRLQPATLSGQKGGAQLSAIYAPFRQHIEAELTGRDLAIADLQEGRGNLLHGAAVPVIDRFRGGTWSGSLQYFNGAWAGKVRIFETATSLPGLGSPLKVASADVEFREDRLSIRRLVASTSGFEVYGEYRYEPASDRPHRFSLSVPSADLSQFERALLPTLRRDSSFFSRTFRRTPVAPEWLRTRRADGTIRVGILTAGEETFRAVRAKLLWNGVNAQLTSITARIDDATVDASATIDLSRAEPKYTLTGSVENMEWRGAAVDASGSLATSGLGVMTLANLSLAGKYEIRALQLPPDLQVRTASGTLEFAASRLGPQLKLTVAQASVGGERFTGEGATGADGKLQLDLASATRAMRLSGPVLPLKLEVTQR